MYITNIQTLFFVMTINFVMMIIFPILNTEPSKYRAQYFQNNLVNYLSSISFWVFVNPFACALTKYIPLAALSASQVRLYVPASI